MKREEIYHKSFAVEPGTVLQIFGRTGGIDVRSWDRDDLEVVALKYDNWLTRLLPEPSVDVTSGREFVVRTVYSSTLSQAVPVDSQVMVPKTVKVGHLETATGAINAENVSGDVDAKTSSGMIQIKGVDGFARAETSTGSIDIERVKGVDGAQTATGSISVEVPAVRNNLAIRAKTGSITAFLAPTIAGELEASTSTGKIAYENLPLTVNQSSDKKLVGRLGKDGSKIDIATSTGSISLKRLA